MKGCEGQIIRTIEPSESLQQERLGKKESRGSDEGFGLEKSGDMSGAGKMAGMYPNLVPPQ